jgi:hypothetical protein
MRHVAFPAGRLGDWDVYIDELGRERLQELEALWEVEPWGDERADRRAQAHTMILAAAFGNSSAIDPSLFDYLKLDESVPPADPRESEARVRAVLHRAED